MKNLTIKDFKVGDEAYILHMHRGYNRNPEIKKTTVKAVGRKYVTVGAGVERKFSELDKPYLIGKVTYGEYTMLFKTEQAANEYLEKCNLVSELGRNGMDIYAKYSLDQLRRIKAILDEPAGIEQEEKEPVRCVQSNEIYSIQSFCSEFLDFCPIIRGDRDELRTLLDREGYEDLGDYPLDEIDEVLGLEVGVVLVDTSYVDKVDGEYQTITEYRWVETGE